MKLALQMMEQDSDRKGIQAMMSVSWLLASHRPMSEPDIALQRVDGDVEPWKNTDRNMKSGYTLGGHFN